MSSPNSINPERNGAPPWPSLYWPVRPKEPKYIESVYTIWRFTIMWTLVIIGAMYLATSLYAIALQPRKKSPYLWIVPAVYIVIAGIEGVLGGSVVGVMIAAVYSAGNVRVSTWIPFVWGIINALVLILASFSIQGGL